MLDGLPGANHVSGLRRPASGLCLFEPSRFFRPIVADVAEKNEKRRKDSAPHFAASAFAETTADRSREAGFEGRSAACSCASCASWRRHRLIPPNSIQGAAAKRLKRRKKAEPSRVLPGLAGLPPLSHPAARGPGKQKGRGIPGPEPLPSFESSPQLRRRRVAPRPRRARPINSAVVPESGTPKENCRVLSGTLL
jgi:hypothetical protein